MDERVQKILSQWGVASRRQAEKMILAGRVYLNGRVVQLGQTADPINDKIELDGKVIQITDRPQHLYLLLNKPAGVISTCDDPQNRPTVLDLLPSELQQGQGLHPVGRLDYQSTGALLLTNDGELTLSLTHPRYHLPKTYQAWVQGHPPEKSLQHWREGVILSGRKTLPAQVKKLSQKQDQTLLEIVLTEGRNRQIRRVADQLGFRVIQLHRTAIGKILLNPDQKTQLRTGEYRFLKDFEIRSLKHQIKLSKKQKTAPIQEHCL
jgi:23S rRNA pseudouridine2605 synthase